LASTDNKQVNLSEQRSCPASIKGRKTISADNLIAFGSNEPALAAA